MRNTESGKNRHVFQRELNVEVLTVAVGVGVVPRAALLAPRPGKLGSAETPPDGVAASRQRPHRAAAAHCNGETAYPVLGAWGKAHSNMVFF